MFRSTQDTAIQVLSFNQALTKLFLKASLSSGNTNDSNLIVEFKRYEHKSDTLTVLIKAKGRKAVDTDGSEIQRDKYGKTRVK